MSKLALVVNFLGIDKMSGAVKNITASAKAGSASIKTMGKDVVGLERELKGVQREMRSATGNVTDLINRERALESQIASTNQQIAAQTKRLARLETISNIGNKLASAGTTMTLGLTLPIVAMGAASLQAGKDNVDALGQVRAALTSMGPVAGRTEAQLRAASVSLSRGSLYEDDQILRQVTANLLTFGKVADGQFDRAQQAALDLSTRLKGDLKGSTLLVGKALNDPVKGITALTRAGVSFDASQKALIKRMAATGNVAGAQNLILKELEKQFGGSAKAALDADPGGALAKSFADFQGVVGERLLPLLTPLIIKTTDLIDRFAKLSPEMQNIALGGAAILAGLGPVLWLGGNLVKLGGGIYRVWSGLGGLKTIFNVLRGGALLLGKSILFVGRALLMNPIGLLVTAIGVAAYLIWTHWDSIKAAFWSAVSALGRAWVSIKAAFGNGMSFLYSLLPGWAKIGVNIVGGLINGITTAGPRLWAALKNLAERAWKAVNDFFEIKSPSRLMARMGVQIGAGLAQGIDRGGRNPIGSMARLASGVAAAGAMTLAPAAARPAEARGAPASASITAGGGGITINVYAAPGQDAEAIARVVMAKLKSAQGVDERGSFDDDV